ncbi:Uncharacterised protein [Raoultella planticola]|uniref:Uncharacterized protein n=1 Tax=Raoultella planticola TaxID=575 RepID=A0A485CHE7_RAOPL|nr:Uncharacterised protein [Raoultella planticola]
MDYQLTLNWPDFIERYWQKRPVVLKRGFANFVDSHLARMNWPGWRWKAKSIAAWSAIRTGNGRSAMVLSKATTI